MVDQDPDLDLGLTMAITMNNPAELIRVRGGEDVGRPERYTNTSVRRCAVWGGMREGRYPG